MTAEKRQRQGEGGVYRRKSDGMWVGRVELPADATTGKRRQKTVYAKTEALVRQKLAAEKKTLAAKGNIVTGGMTVSQWMAYWYENIDKSRPRTRAGYRSKIKYIDDAVGKIKLTKLTPADVRKVEHRIVQTLGLSPTSALQAYQILAKALKDAEREERVDRNVARLVDPPRRAVATSRVLSPAEGIAVIRSVTGDRLGSRWAAALLTGARQGELLGLEIDRVGDVLDLSWQLQRITWRHGCGLLSTSTKLHPCGAARGTDCPSRRLDAPADWEHRHLTGGLYLSRPKSRAGWRIIPLIDPLKSIIERRLDAAQSEPNPHGLVWTAEQKKSKGGRADDRKLLDLDGSPIDPSRDNAAWHAVLANAQATDIRLHDARHTAVTILYDLGVPETVIQDIVGQSTISVTRAYRHKNQKPMREALAALGGALA